MAVTFSYADRSFNFPGKKRLKAFIDTLINNEQEKEALVSYVFCSDEFLLDINRRFLNHDYYTDIITFDLSEVFELSLKGEIYISIDRVKDNALSLNTNFQDEITRVIFHGALHLCGYRDKKKREIVIMRQKEEHYLRLYKETQY